ncbi:TetR/AcrR family transcriptional regulator [Rhodococcus aerolatus]
MTAHATTDEPAPPRRRTQEERTAQTRHRLLEATLDCLVDDGYARTTTQAIAARAGLSRGAQLHHFPTKESLVVGAVEHLAQKRHAEMQAALTGATSPAVGLELLADTFSGPLFLAALELWVAARTEPALRAALEPLERRVADELVAVAPGLLGLSTAPADAELVELTVELVRGLGMAVLFNSPEQAARRRRRLLDRWAHEITRSAA